jgi:hypothetical protein
MARGSDSGHDSEDRDLETESLFPSDVRSDSARATNSTAADPPADVGDRIVAFEKAAFGVDNSPAFRTDAGDRAHAVSGVAPATAAAFGELPPAGRSRKRVLIFAAIVVLLAVAAVGVGIPGNSRMFGTGLPAPVAIRPRCISRVLRSKSADSALSVGAAGFEPATSAV